MKIELRSKREMVFPPAAPEIPGLTFRSFRGEADYPNMLDIIHASAKADGVERADTLEDITRNYAHLHHCDPERDMLFAEVNGRAVGYARVWWELQGDGTWMGFSLCFVHPEYRRMGLGTAFLAFNEKRLHEIAVKLEREGTITAQTSCLFDNFVSEKEAGRQAILEQNGYQVVRMAYNMVRPDLENIPEVTMPVGLVVRTATLEEYRKVWEASNEAFRDHWGYIPDSEEYLKSWYDDPKMDPTLWRVAWDGNEVAGMVLSFIDVNENLEYHRKRGYTENICVRRPYRRKGLARSLIVQSLQALKERGMTEAALGVDAENVTGALQLYESCGFQVVEKHLIYRKPMELHPEER